MTEMTSILYSKIISLLVAHFVHSRMNILSNAAYFYVFPWVISDRPEFCLTS